MTRAHHFFDQGWARSPDGLAYVAGAERWTFREAGELSCRIGHALAAAGLAPNAKVAVLSPNSVVAWLCVLGIWRAGMAWVPLNPGSKVQENIDLLAAFDCEMLFFHSSLAAAAEAMQAAVPTIRLCVATDATSTLGPYLSQWVAAQPAIPPQSASAADDVIAIMPTGGTTGKPKGVMNTHRSFANAWAHMLLAFRYRDDEPIVVLAAAPMTHTAGVMSIPASARGGTVVILERADPAAVIEAIGRHRITELFLPPTVIYRMLDLLAKPAPERPDFSSLRYFVYAAAPMALGRLKEAIAVFGPVMTELYGQTEAPAAITFMRPDEHLQDGAVAPDFRLSSCGRPYPLVEVEIRDGGRRADPGQPGEVCVRGDLLMKGYYKDPERTAETIVDGWLLTGDVGFLDADGYLHITDRKKDMIISGGYNVYPGEVEQVLAAHPAVRECAVIGVPDSDWGERVVGVVELAERAQVSEDELRAACKAALGSIKAPKQIVFIDELPRSVNGKVLKRTLRDAYWRDAGRTI
jgi:acyl-CoA synthetase (AMP-forming)/AMP-acid ligase II